MIDGDCSSESNGERPVRVLASAEGTYNGSPALLMAEQEGDERRLVVGVRACSGTRRMFAAARLLDGFASYSFAWAQGALRACWESVEQP